VVKNIYDFKPLHGQKYAENCGSELSSCGLRKKLRLRNCGVAVAEQHFLKSCGIAIAEVLPQVAELRLRTQKKVARAHLWLFVTCSITSV
jgi:hypothetical protein